MRLPLTSFSLVALLVGVALAGCKKEEPPPSTDGATSASAANAADDPKLAKALASVSSAKPSADPGRERGIYTTEHADKEAAVGSEPQLEVASLGEEPRLRVALGAVPKGAKVPLTVAFQTILGQQGTPPLAATFELTALDKLSGPTAAGSGSAAADGSAAPAAALSAAASAAASVSGSPAASVAPAASGSAGALVPLPMGVLAVVKKLDMIGQAAAVPPELQKLFKALEGTKVELALGRRGGVVWSKVELPKDAKPELSELFAPLSELLPLLFFPAPSEPVGKGATWMFTAREKLRGIDTVAYRMVKVQDVSENGAVLEVSVKRMAVGEKHEIPRAGSLEFAQFQGDGSGKLLVKLGEPAPSQGQLVDSFIGATGDGKALFGQALGAVGPTPLPQPRMPPGMGPGGPGGGRRGAPPQGPDGDEPGGP